MSGLDRRAALASEAWAVLRVRQWIVFAPLPAAGLAHLDELRGARALHVLGAVIAGGLSLAYAYGINAIFDRRTDHDPTKNALAGHERVPPAAIASVVSAGLAALLLASALGAIPLAAVATSIAAGTVYSAGPRLKRFPVAGLVANDLIFSPLLLAAVRPGAISRSLWLLVVIFVLLVTQNQLAHEEADAAEDETAGALTTARWLGPRGVRWTVLALAAGIAGAGTLAPTALEAAIAIAAGLASALCVLAIEPAAARRRAHRHLAVTIGVALFLASLQAPR